MARHRKPRWQVENGRVINSVDTNRFRFVRYTPGEPRKGALPWYLNLWNPFAMLFAHRNTSSRIFLPRFSSAKYTIGRFACREIASVQLFGCGSHLITFDSITLVLEKPCLSCP